jgi:hypothetical protein
LRLVQALFADADIHSVEDKSQCRNNHSASCRGGLLLPGDTLQVFGGQLEKRPQLDDPLLGDVTRCMCGLGFVEKPLGFLEVGARYVQCVFQGCFVFQNLFAFHASILVRFPG